MVYIIAEEEIEDLLCDDDVDSNRVNLLEFVIMTRHIPWTVFGMLRAVFCHGWRCI